MSELHPMEPGPWEEPEAGAVEVRCDSCGAVVTIPAGQRTSRCPFCDAPYVVERPASRERPEPTFALGFVVEREDAVRAARKWIRGRRMAPFGLSRAATERITGVYLPCYLYSSTARSGWVASIAEQYKRRRKTETEFRDLRGSHVMHVSDLLVTASERVANQELAAVEPFDLAELRRYQPALIAGWHSEEPSLSPEACMRLGRTEAEERIATVLRAFMPGDWIRSLDHDVELVEESLDSTLVPLWVVAMRYDAKRDPVRVLVNGQTGKAGGRIPISWGKVAAIVVAVLVLAGLLAIGWWVLSGYLS